MRKWLSGAEVVHGFLKRLSKSDFFGGGVAPLAGPARNHSNAVVVGAGIEIVRTRITLEANVAEPAIFYRTRKMQVSAATYSAGSEINRGAASSAARFARKKLWSKCAQSSCSTPGVMSHW